MNIYVIAILNDINNRKYRLIDLDDNNKTMDVTSIALINVLKQNKLKVNNIRLVNNKLYGKQYSIGLLPVINEYKQETQKVIVLDCVNNAYFRIANCTGEVKVVPVQYINTIPNIINFDKYGNIACTKTFTTNEYKEACNIKNKLENEVKDKTVIWNIHTFDKYMREHGYWYKIERLDPLNTKVSSIDELKPGEELALLGVSDNCKILHLPKEVTTIEYLYQCDNTVVDTIIFGPYVTNINRFTHKNYEDKSANIFKNRVNNIYFQKPETKEKTTREIYCKGLNHLIIANNCETPHAHTVNNLYNYCYINNLTISDEIDTIFKSFTKIKSNNTQINSNIRDYYQSFASMQNIGKIKIGNKARVISDSFKESPINTIDLSEAKELTTLSYAFGKLDNLISVDLSGCTKLDKITGSFRECTRLKNVRFNKNVDTISSWSFEKTNITEIDLPENIKTLYFPVFDDNTTIKFTGENKELTAITLMQYEGWPNIDFGNAFKVIRTDALKTFDNTMKPTLTLPNSIELLEDKALAFSFYKEFDTNCIPKVTKIPKYCLAESRLLDTLIINENILEIDQNITVNCFNLRNVVIGQSVKKINKNAFNNIKKGLPPTFFVIENSYAHKFVVEKCYPHILIESVDKYTESLNKRTAQEVTIAKYAVLLRDSEYDWLLKEPAKFNIDFWFRTIKQLEEDKPLSKLELDTSKFVNISIYKYPGISEKYEKYLEIFNSPENKKPYEGYSENKFIALSNLITTLGDNCIYCYEEDFINSIGLYGINCKQPIYLDENNAILLIFSAICGVEVSFIQIIQNKNIVFQLPFKVEDICESHSTNSEILTYKTWFFAPNYSIAPLFKCGDGFLANNKYINNVEIPIELITKLEENLKSTLLYIGTTFNNELENETKISNIDGKAIDLLYYDVVDSLFVEMSSLVDYKVDVDTKVKIKNREYFKIKNIYKLSEIDKIDKQYFAEYKKAINNKINNNGIRLLSVSKQDMDNMFNDASQFDVNGDKEVWQLADTVFKSEVQSANTLKPGIMEKLLKTTLVEQIEISMNKCNKKNYDKKLYIIENSDKVVIEYTTNIKNSIGNTTYIIGLIDGNTRLSDTKVLYASERSLNSLIQTLYLIGAERDINKDIKTPLNKITNEKINPDAFIFAFTFMTLDFSTTGLKIHLAFDRMNGDSYILADIWDTDFYTIFRFKNYKDAKETFARMVKSTKDQNEVLDIINKINDVYTGVIHNALYKIRNTILEGYPNNYPYIYYDLDLFNKLAKQI